MGKRLLIASAALVGASLAAAAIFMVAMMGTMFGRGHVGMMGGQGSDPAQEAAVEGVTQVRMDNFAFVPANIIVDAGATVTWTNYDNIGHTVTSDEGDELKSLIFGENGTFSYTFDEPGQYLYHCEPHPNMKGLVTVRAPVS